MDTLVSTGQMNRRHHLMSLGGIIVGASLPRPTQADAALAAMEPDPEQRPEWITPRVDAPGLSFHTFRSEVAATEVSFHLLAPPAIAAEPSRRLPVVYWLHGSGGGVSGISQLSARAHAAVASGEVQPFLMVFVNGLRMGMYVDWANGRAPLETMIVHELRPHIEANWPTIATARGRLLDGFSMGGYGAARFGFRYPELFGTVSMMGAGPLQETLERTPRASQMRAEALLRDVYGGDQQRFLAVSPRRLAEQNAGILARNTRLRLVIGDRDETFANNLDFHTHLLRLGIPHEWIVLPGVGHSPLAVLDALGDRHWAFYRAAFAAAGA